MRDTPVRVRNAVNDSTLKKRDRTLRTHHPMSICLPNPYRMNNESYSYMTFGIRMMNLKFKS